MQPPARRKATVNVDEPSSAAEKHTEAASSSGVLPFLAEVVVGFVFWSIFAEGVPALWYIPMNNMELSGVEPFLFVYCLIGLLAIRRLREFLINNPLAHLVSVGGLLAMFSTSVLVYGSSVITFSGLHLLVMVGQLLHPNSAVRERKIYALLLGLITLVIIRFGFASISPLFTFGSWSLGAIAALAVACYVLHQNRGLPVRLSSAKESPVPSSRNDFAVAIGLGAFLLLNVFYLTEHGVLARWDDVHPFPMGLMTMAAMVAGIFLSRYNFARSWVWFITALLATVFTLLYNQPLGAFVGLLLIAYVVSIWPAMIDELNKISSFGAPLAVGGFVYVIGCLGTVWCVAYNFVPGGFFVREWTPQLVLTYLVLTKLGYTALTGSSSTTSASSSHLPGSSSSSAQDNKTRVQNVKLLLIGLAVIAVFVFAPAFLRRAASYGNYDANGLDKSNLRGMVWATHFGYDNFGRPSFDDMLTLIKQTKSNVIALVESDIMRLFSGNRDLTEYFEDQLHMYADYGPGDAEHTWGCAILSAFPFKRVERVKLPSPDGENACLIDVTIDMDGHDVDVIMAHFGNTEHVRDRLQQTEDTYQRLKSRIDAGKKVVWLGYFTSAPGSANYKRVMSTGVLDTTDAKDRYCEYIWYKNMKLKEFKRINQGHVSDTEIQFAEFEPF